MSTQGDPFEEMLRRIYREFQNIIDQIERVYDEEALEDVFYERTRQYSKGSIEPIISIMDMGDSVRIIIDLPGAKESTIDVRVYEDYIHVTASIDERMIKDAFPELSWAHKIRRFEGRYRLPARIDVRRIKMEKKGSRIILTAPKI
ncbi:MAG: Hsp20/alpha crystallin family protein [Desulfurococcales archaeon]|nr:Hsp20/alpha crystallin family protein [Desulfurococcales archaeon]